MLDLEGIEVVAHMYVEIVVALQVLEYRYIDW